MKGLETDARELNRKRYDVSRDGAKPRIIEVRCNPGEHVHPQELCLRVLQHLAPHRKLTSLWETSVGGQQVWMQSAVDWGGGTVPALNHAFIEADARAIWALVATRSAAARPSGRQSKAPSLASCDAPVARELAFLGRSPSRQTDLSGRGDAGRRPALPAPATQAVDEPPW